MDKFRELAINRLSDIATIERIDNYSGSGKSVLKVSKANMCMHDRTDDVYLDEEDIIELIAYLKKIMKDVEWFSSVDYYRNKKDTD